MSKRNIVAAFDFDGTITNKESLQFFLRYVVGNVKFARSVVRTAPTLLRAKRSMIARQHAKERLLEETIGGMHIDYLNRQAERFVEEELPMIIRPEMLGRVHYHKEVGHTVLLVSASPSIYLRPWAMAHGFHDVLSSELQVEGDHYTGKLASTNCWGPEKVHRLRQWWGKERPVFLYAYGDSDGDRDMLSIAQEQWFKGKKVDEDKKP